MYDMYKMKMISKIMEAPKKEQRVLFNATMNNANPFSRTGGGIFSGAVPVSLLGVDPTYQRVDTRSEEKIRRLYLRWDERKLMPIIIVPHPESCCFAVVDGQGRTIVSQMKTPAYDFLNAIILTDVPEDYNARRRLEAELFIGQDSEIEPVKPLQKHNARCILGDKAALILDTLCKEYKVEFTNTKGTRSESVLGSYTETYSIANVHGEKCLRFIFFTITNAGWNCETNGYATYVMRMLRDIWCIRRIKYKRISDLGLDILSGLSPNKVSG